MNMLNKQLVLISILYLNSTPSSSSSSSSSSSISTDEVPFDGRLRWVSFHRCTLLPTLATHAAVWRFDTFIFQKFSKNQRQPPKNTRITSQNRWIILGSISNRCSLRKKRTLPQLSSKLSPLKIGRTPKKETIVFPTIHYHVQTVSLPKCIPVLFASKLWVDPVIRLFSTPFNFSWVSHPTKVPPTKVESLLRKVQWFSELPKVVGDVIYTWNPKQPFINAWLVKQPFSIQRFGIIQLKHPFINGCLGFQVVPWSLTPKIYEDFQIYPHWNQATGNLQVVALPKHSANPGPWNQGRKWLNTSPADGFQPHSKKKDINKNGDHVPRLPDENKNSCKPST